MRPALGPFLVSVTLVFIDQIFEEFAVHKG